MNKVHKINAFNDNLIWLLHGADNKCSVIDPGDAEVVLTFLNEHGLTLENILITHHHHDHIGGVDQLTNIFPNVNIYAPNTSRFRWATHSVNEGDNVIISDHEFSVWELHGHTKDHIGFINDEMAFVGDTLFSGGCGRLFDGTAEQLFASLQRINTLAESTKIYCAHEYTLTNLAFAKAVEPANTHIIQYQDKVERLLAEGLNSIPTDLPQERLINPFLRTNMKTVQQSVQQQFESNNCNVPQAIFTYLRQWKDNF